MLCSVCVMIVFVKYVISIKHMILISSLQLFIMILCGVYDGSELLLLCVLLLYVMSVYYVLCESMCVMSVFVNNDYLLMPFFIVDICNVRQ